MLIYDDRSLNVYENKQNNDKLSLEKSDIYVEVTRILQKIADLDGQFAVKSVCGAGLVRKFTDGANIAVYVGDRYEVKTRHGWDVRAEVLRVLPERPDESGRHLWVMGEKSEPWKLKRLV